MFGQIVRGKKQSGFARALPPPSPVVYPVRTQSGLSPNRFSAARDVVGPSVPDTRDRAVSDALFRTLIPSGALWTWRSTRCRRPRTAWWTKCERGAEATMTAVTRGTSRGPGAAVGERLRRVGLEYLSTPAPVADVGGHLTVQTTFQMIIPVRVSFGYDARAALWLPYCL